MNVADSFSFDRTIDRFLQQRRRCYKRETTIAAVGFAVMMVYVLFGNWLALRLIAFPIAACRLYAALCIRAHQRSLDRIGSSSTETYSGLRALVDRDIAFVRSTFYWYTVPLAVGLIGVAFAVWWHAGSLWVSAACLAASGLLVIGSRSMNAKTVTTLRAVLSREFDATAR
jgi:hypothetical protein